MNSYNDVAGRMAYIQKLFLDTGLKIATLTDVHEMIRLLNTEPPEFRSIAYEGASFQFALKNLQTKPKLRQWIDFREACAAQHSFHMDIGLGWAFARADVWPAAFLSSAQQAVRRMVYDGVGYYHALFKGRATLKSKKIPHQINSEDLQGFDQGIGRRLWYMAKGNASDVMTLVAGFAEGRHADLFRGIGIACGYVGGNRQDELQRLLEMTRTYNKQLQIGILLATVSRIMSNTVDESIECACRIICNKSLAEITKIVANLTTNFFYLYPKDTDGYRLAQLESELLQTG